MKDMTVKQHESSDKNPEKVVFHISSASILMRPIALKVMLANKNHFSLEKVTCLLLHSAICRKAGFVTEYCSAHVCCCTKKFLFLTHVNYINTC